MTILATITKQSFSCNGSLREFDFTFPAVSADNIKALILDSSGIETELTVTAQYSVTLNPDGSGGALTTVATWAAGNTLIVYRETEHTQETEYKNNQAFDQGVLTSDLDKATMMIQEVDEKVGRALKLKKSSALESVEVADLVAGKVLKVNSSGDGIDMGPVGDDIASAQANAEAAATARDGAQTAQAAAELARDKAGKWAEETENVEVETGKYSAKHYSAKAAESAAGVNLPSLVVGDANKILRVKDDESGYELVDNTVSFATSDEITTGTETAKAIAPDQLKASSPTFANITDSGLTASQMVYTDANKKLISKTFDKARAYCSTAQSIPTATNTKIAINTKSFDPSGIVDTTNNRIKPTKAGYYQINGQVLFDNVADAFCQLYLNGASIAIGSRGGSNIGNGITVSDIIYLNGSTDYIELYIYQNSGANANLANWGSHTNYLSIVGPF